MLTDLPKRLLGSSVSLCGVGALLYFAHHFFFQYLVVVLVAGLTGVGVWEYAQFAKVKGAKMHVPLFVGCGFLQVLSFYFSARYPAWDCLPMLFFFLAFFLFFALHFRQKEGSLSNLSLISFGLLYVSVPMGMLVGILYMPKVEGTWWVAYLLFVTKMTDVGAYFGGNLFGKRKLASHISPGKTIEGAWVGLFAAIGVSFLFYWISRRNGLCGFSLGPWEWVVLGVILGVVGQFSDLAESLLKRDVNKKDSNQLPGLGGVLDTIDSLLFNAPIIFLYLNFLRPACS